jgi:hypothetical protein
MEELKQKLIALRTLKLEREEVVEAITGLVKTRNDLDAEILETTHTLLRENPKLEALLLPEFSEVAFFLENGLCSRDILFVKCEQ